MSATGGPVAVLAPMASELRPLLKPLGLRPDAALGPAAHRGRRGGREAVAVRCGVGIDRAARATERLLDAVRPSRVVVVGVAGGIGPSVAVGDLIVPERVVDLASGAEYRPETLGRARARGALVTSDGLIADPARLARLAREGVVAVDMETAAVAAVCARRGCPFSVFRGISDRADDGSVDEAVFALTREDGTPDLAAVARFVATGPWRIPRLVRLGHGLRRATRTAASACVAALDGETG